MTTLAVSDVSVSYGTHVALDEVSLVVPSALSGSGSWTFRLRKDITTSSYLGTLGAVDTGSITGGIPNCGVGPGSDITTPQTGISQVPEERSCSPYGAWADNIGLPTEWRPRNNES
jgi:ABC-type nitrate/sulfonate/bicarbonate transport system, ATPase component